MNAYVLAEVFDSIGLPPGVFNLVTGTGAGVGETLVAHPGSRHGLADRSTVAGRRIGAVAAETIKRVALELGGKSPLIILDDADIVAAVSAGLLALLPNSGQTCIALTRMIVPRSKLAEVEAVAKAGAESMIVGDPFDPATVLGPLVSAAAARPGGRPHREGHRRGRPTRRRRAHCAGRAGAWLLRPPYRLLRCHPGHGDRAGGDFRARSRIQAYDDEDEAVRLANDTIFGLNAASSRAMRNTRSGRPPDPGRARSRSTTAHSTSTHRSAATGSRATAANSAGGVSRSSSRPSQCNCPDPNP